MKKILLSLVITNGQEMFSVFVLFGEDVWKISFALDVFDVYEFLMYNFSHSVLMNCYKSEAFGISSFRQIYVTHFFII